MESRPPKILCQQAHDQALVLDGGLGAAGATTLYHDVALFFFFFLVDETRQPQLRKVVLYYNNNTIFLKHFFLFLYSISDQPIIIAIQRWPGKQ